jgi:hypothetical protein
MAQPVEPLPHRDAVLQEKATDLIDDRGPLPHQAVAHTVQRLEQVGPDLALSSSRSSAAWCRRRAWRPAQAAGQFCLVCVTLPRHFHTGTVLLRSAALAAITASTAKSVPVLAQFVWMDLRAEPVVLSVPAVDPKRYYSVMLCDGNTYNYGYIGSRATGSEAGDYMVVGPDWKGATPPGIEKVFRSSTQFSVAGYRTQLFNPDDLDNVKKVQAGYKVQTLSAYLKQPATVGAAPAIDFPKIDKELVKTNFFEYLDFALQFAPAQENEKEIRAQLARIGVGPGKTLNFKDLSMEDKLEIGLGMKEGDRKVDEAVANAGKAVNGWRVSGLPGDSAHYNGDWLMRAAAAKAGIYGNDPAEATYPITRIDSDGQTLDGSKSNYTLTFLPGQQPPVNAFWSLTMYDGKTQLLIENPINRYLINSPMLPGMKTNADGSLTLYIQNKSPGADKEANWLPAPNGTIYLVMRLYWPKTEAPSILPPGEGTWQPPGIKRVA